LTSPSPTDHPNHPDIPPNYRRFPLSSFEQCDGARAWLEDPRSWSYYIAGGLGSGKSCLAAAILVEYRTKLTQSVEVRDRRYEFPPTAESQAAISNFHQVRIDGGFVGPYVLADGIRDWSNPQYRRWRENRGPLVLDDIGAVRDTPHVTEQLLHLLQYRYDHQLKTIITANLSVAQFAKHVDPRAASRLQEGAMIDMGDIDRRRKSQ